MTKRKLLLAVITILLVLALTGCEHKHEFECKPHIDGGHYYVCDCGEEKNEIRYVHEFDWKNISSYEDSYRACGVCGYKEQQNELYNGLVRSASDIDGDPGITSPIYFVAETESGIHNYGEEFNISLEVTMPHGFNAGGPVYVRLAESPYFEIVGDAMQVVSDPGNIAQDNKYRFYFRVRPTSPCNMPQ